MLKIPPYVSWNPVAGELALFDARDGKYHALNGSAAAIWRAIAAGLDEPALVHELMARYDAPHETIAQAVSDFVATALAKGILIMESVE